MNVKADVVIIDDQRFPRVHAHPDPDRGGGEARLGLLGAGDRIPGGGEHAEERVTLCIDLDAAMGCHCSADEAVVLTQRLRIVLRAAFRERAS